MPSPGLSLEDQKIMAEALRDAQQTLPPLSVQNSFAEWLRTISSRLLQWLNESLQIPAGSFIPNLVVIIFWVVLGVLIASTAVLLWQTWRRLKYRRQLTGARISTDRPVQSPGSSSLTTELAHALTAGLFQRALRLRWKLFLLTHRLPPGTTPQEYCNECAANPPSTVWTARYSTLMFSPHPLSLDIYDQLTKDLDALQPSERSDS